MASLRWTLAFGLVLFAAKARALTPPISGAVSLPNVADLRAPFPAGAQVRILAGYGPAMGSGLHADTDRTNKANDHYALDLDYADELDGGLGLPILAPLGGTVVKAGWATSGWANYGLRIILAHDLGEGEVYHSLYAHLNAISSAIVEGETVTRGQVLGELGRSCQGQLSCGSFSAPHLHFALHKGSTVGGSGTGGSYGGNAVVPEPFDGAEDLLRFDVVISTNTDQVVCGDGLCAPKERHTCAADCPVCEPVSADPDVARIIDNDDPCFSLGGNPAYWRIEEAGFGGDLHWTHTTDASEVDNHAIWELRFLEAGTYHLEVYTAQAFAESARARYQVRGLSDAEVMLDQRAVDGWQSLGVFGFAEG